MIDPTELAFEHVTKCASEAAEQGADPVAYLRHAVGLMLGSGFMMALQTEGPAAAQEFVEGVMSDFSAHCERNNVPCKVQIASYDGPGTGSTPFERG